MYCIVYYKTITTVGRNVEAQRDRIKEDSCGGHVNVEMNV